MNMQPVEAPRQVLLAAAGLRVGYDGKALLPSVDFQVARGEVWAVIGRNGSGKTTLLRTLLGLLPKVGGEVRWTPGVRPAMVPQRSDIDLAVRARVVDLACEAVETGWSFLSPFWLRKHRPAVESALRDTDTVAFRRRQFAELSEGQKQRVLMARALASDPDLLVLDEPTGAMDVANEVALMDLVDRLRRERSLGVVIVSHHIVMVVQRATHLLFVDRDDGIVVCGPVDEAVRNPQLRERYGALLDHAAAARGGQP